MSVSRIWSSVVHFFSVQAVDSRIKPDPEFKRRRKLFISSSKNETGSSSIKSIVSTVSGTTRSPVSGSNNPSLSLWNTWEFRLYYLAFLIVLPWMLKAALATSSDSNPNYYKYSGLLSRGWLLGRKVDNSDSQYRFFRSKFFPLSVLILLQTALKKLFIKFSKSSKIYFDFACGLVFICLFYGINSIKFFTHAFIFFTLAHSLKRKRSLATLAIWSYGVFTLFINQKVRNFPFSNIATILNPMDHWYKGIIPRWDFFFNFTLLRLLSYSMDFLERWHEQLSPQPTTNYEDNQPEFRKSSSVSTLQTIYESGKNSALDEKDRMVAEHHIQDYNFINFIAYITYAPLFLVGPIITFNDYLYQTGNKLPSLTRKSISLYALKVFLSLLLMEIVLHFFYVGAIARTKAWSNDTPLQLAMIGLFNLNIMYLKLLIPWRLFRLWAMIDGIDAPENMLRCVDNNYSSLGFWRAWHTSFNKWVIRYIYVPFGGSNNRISTSFAVFSFVAIWHNIEFRLLFWGWLTVFLLLAETFVTKCFIKYRFKVWYRFFCGAGAVINICMMMVVNLYGFCLGADGTKLLLRDIFSTLSGLEFSLMGAASLFIAVQIMFEIREEEKRHGINLKC
ncbi:Glycerol uptake protein 2 [Saccharomyces pastorianus]|uniref:Glycerol uptake protein 2 n=1 Tax=Saccharomyces pastorianus TaxID=27292 RepID=A0A6C1EGT0_SACPS|nr:GUP2-like protein [Saccharomyces eubayanus]KOG96131.1 GUP2-like protein [Saccharomyces eubayanus]QID88249.1 Glycerol uptake protein 2 [Saccharomyces pastorianus]